MLTRLCLGLASALLVPTSLLPSTPADASTDRAAKRGVTLKASAKEVQEGDRLKLTAKIKGAASATKVTLQRRSIPIYGEPEWLDVRTKSVKGKKRVHFRVVAASENSEKYRARVTFRDGKSVTSKPVSVTIWRWIPLPVRVVLPGRTGLFHECQRQWTHLCGLLHVRQRPSVGGAVHART